MTNLGMPAITHLLAFEPSSLTIGPFETDVTDSGTFCQYLEQATLVVNPRAGTCDRSVDVAADVRESDDETSRPLDETNGDAGTNNTAGSQPATDAGSEGRDEDRRVDKPDEQSGPAGQAEKVQAEDAEQDERNVSADKAPKAQTPSQQVKGTDCNGLERQLVTTTLVTNGDAREQGRAGEAHTIQVDSHELSAPNGVRIRKETGGDVAAGKTLEETSDRGAAPNRPTKQAGQQAELTKIPTSPASSETDLPPISASRSPSDEEKTDHPPRPAKEKHHRDTIKGHAVNHGVSKSLPATESVEVQSSDPLTRTEIAPEISKVPGEDSSVKVIHEGQVETRGGTTQVTPSAPSDGLNEAPTRVTAARAATSSSSGEMHKADSSDQADRVRFVQRVARAFQAIAGREGNLRLRLHPPELGSLRLELAVRGGVMTARLEAENTTAKNLLLDNLPALRDRLAEQDIRIERFEVDLAGRSSNGSPREPGDRPQYQDRSEQNSGPSQQRGPAVGSEVTHAGHPQGPRHTGNLDVTI